LMGLNRYLHGSIPSTVGPLVESNRSKVGNIVDYIPVKMTMEEFEKVFLDAFQMANQLVLEERKLTAIEFDSISSLADSKYRSFEWNYGETPPFSKHIFDEMNQLIAIMDIHQATIEHVTMTSPNSSLNLQFLENQRFEIETIKRLLVEFGIEDPSKWLERIFR
ncbi:MAG: hypothetical protein U1C51_01135, partial [Candidatus Izemoplasmatales bacterium]|nr:hypothetical protein [Candidatus Izemoplasmatales bacterium]